MIKVLTGFYHRATRCITGMMAKRGAGGEWDYPSVVEAMEAAGIYPIGVYIKKRQMTIAKMVACRSVYALCKEAERIPGTSQIVR